MHLDDLRTWGLRRVADIRIDGDYFTISLTEPEASELDQCVYAFVVDGEIIRVGSCMGLLKGRMRQWERDVSRALNKAASATPPGEAQHWRDLLKPGVDGAVYARRGTTVTTPVGALAVFLDEERALIKQLKPKLNWSWR